MSNSFYNDLTGQRFGRLTVMEFVPMESPHSYWQCMCDCGNKTIARGTHLQSGNVTSCGCISIQRRYKHGKSQSRIYKIWVGMKNRCYNPNNRSYKRYGGRGIIMCEEWKTNFTAFRDWALAHGYDETLSIDRIDVDGNYEPSNCRWSNAKQQSRNRTTTTKVIYKGEELSVVEAAEKTGIDVRVLYTRYYAGDRGERLFRPIKKNKK